MGDTAVDTALLMHVLAWCIAVDVILLLLWGGFLALAPDLIYRLQTSFLPMERDVFNRMHFLCFGIFKILAVVLHLAPYIALRIAV